MSFIVSLMSVVQGLILDFSHVEVGGDGSSGEMKYLQLKPHTNFGVTKTMKYEEPVMGFEPATHALRKHCSTPELHRLLY